MFASFAQTLEKVFVQITSTNICDLVMSILIMLAVYVVKELNDIYKAKLPVPIPIEVITVRETFKEDIYLTTLRAGVVLKILTSCGIQRSSDSWYLTVVCHQALHP